MQTLWVDLLTSVVLGMLLTVFLPGCGGGSSEQTGQGCTPTPDIVAGTCFNNISPLQGDPVCLTRVPGGYCTHTCQTDDNCCAVPGECRTGFPQVCAPFESTDQLYCFLSCEDSDLPSNMDSTTYCQNNANSAFICRSTGGGSKNRKVCVPNG